MPIDPDPEHKHTGRFGRRAFVLGAATTAVSSAIWSVPGKSTARAEDTTTASPLARQLWSEVYCMCGDCDHMPLAECTCDDSARVRTEIAAQVQALGFATPGAAQKTRSRVLQKYAKRFGAQALVANDDRARRAVLHGVGAAAVAALTIGGLIFITERLRKRLPPSRALKKSKRQKR